MYGKVFTSIWEGSLYGRLEASATLMALVTLCNADGVIDMTMEAISGRTGWPIGFIQAGIKELEQPDPRSRTADYEGRRLIKLDDHRDWGWVLVNYQKYREKKDLDVQRQQTRERVIRCRARQNSSSVEKRSVTLCNAPKRQAEAEAYTEAEANKKAAQPPVLLHSTLPVETWEEWLAWRREKRFSVSPRCLNPQLELLARYTTEQQTEMLKTSLRSSWRGIFAPRGSSGKPLAESFAPGIWPPTEEPDASV